MLSIHSFVKSFDGQRILSIDALSLPPGTHFIRGDNGSGKTTFFKCVAGISPYAGEIRLDELVLSKEPVLYRLRVNYAEAEPVYPGFLTGRDLIRFVGQAKKASRKQIDYYTERLGIHGYYLKASGTYSSGMLKKLSLALAFLGDPRLIVLDEPLITLDAPARETLFEIIKEKTDTLFLLSSHQAIESGHLHVNRSYKIENKTLVDESLA